jgi:hypothetical protein
MKKRNRETYNRKNTLTIEIEAIDLTAEQTVGFERGLFVNVRIEQQNVHVFIQIAYIRVQEQCWTLL